MGMERGKKPLKLAEISVFKIKKNDWETISFEKL